MATIAAYVLAEGGKRTISYGSRALHVGLSGNLSTAAVVPSFVIHPKYKRLQEHHVFELINCHRESSKPPNRFVDYINTLDIKPWEKNIEKATVFENVFQTSSFDTAQLAANKNLSIVQNLLKVVLSQSLEYDVLRGLHVTGEFKISSWWYYKGNRLDVRGTPPGLLIKSRDPPDQPFFTPDDMNNMIEEDDNIEDQDLLDVSIDTSKLFSNLTTRDVRSDPPLNLASSYPYNHTLIRVHNYDSIDSSVIHNTVLYLHGLAVQQAMARGGGKMADDLPAISPECVQCILTNGKEFLFVWYQLNTLLDKADDDNRNIVMFSNPEHLFSDVICTTRRTDYSSRKLDNYNEHVLKKFISFFLWQV